MQVATLFARLAGLFCLVTLFLAVPAAAQTFPQLTGRVVDQANIIPDDREAALTAQLEQLQRATSRQLVVATVASLEGYPIEDYGYRLGREWGIGQSEANNGVILLVAPTERRVRIEVGYGLEGILTDALSSRIINEQIVPRFRENDYAGGVEVGAAAIVSQLAAPLEQAEQRALEAEQARQRRDSGGDNSGDGIIVIVVLSFIALIFIRSVVASRSHARRGRVSPWGYYDQRRDDDGVGWVVAGALLDAILSGPRGGSSSWSSGGGSFGGSSWGGGGGGSSWGGGGGFSGGGGSFGGGGASGSW